MNFQLSLYILFFIYVWEADTYGSCHYFSDHKLDYFSAIFACQKKKLCLANFDSKVAFDDVSKKFNVSDEFWIGLNGYEKQTFRYVSNNKGLQYMPPHTEINLETPCVFLKPIHNGQLTFGTDHCIRRRFYVCSSASICNGLETNSTFKEKYIEIPCDMSQEVRDLIGIPKNAYK